MILDDATRNVNYGNEVYCDTLDDHILWDENYKSPDWKGPGWYRMMGKAGTQLPEHDVEPRHCGTFATGWLSGIHPTAVGEIVDRTVCFHSSGIDDSCRYQTQIQVINCGNFYLYNLRDMTEDIKRCDLRYCSQ